ncbi:glycoside hydrolase family 5 protein [Pterulicium gracile]|uniref:Glycoside hydrolase family 5 protein n=1 Tax=Pterulicium gracile TaxID=1884261 RepID=A0A5C3QFL3_9AGAR|nr:glycoside hydrolase family 5 protein [Pterula gracilis]
MSNQAPPTSFLAVRGTKIVHEDSGAEIILRGAGLGGWLCMENFISGFSGCEFQAREALEEVLGEEKAEFFFDKFLTYFFTASDAKFFKSLSLNCIRIALNYRHFESDSAPRTLRFNCFAHLDRVVALCAEQGIYTILDMHTAPGGQSGGWHCDSALHLANFWRHKDFQDRFVWLWTILAERYKDNAWIAGYNLLNEPADPHPGHASLIALYDRTIAAVRAVDSRHTLYLDGNTFATDFTKFPENVRGGERWGENVAYSIHDYSVYGFASAPEPYARTPEQMERQKNTYLRKRKWMDERGLCVWNGEWGPVYARKAFDGDGFEETNERRYNVLDDQLAMYGKDGLSWSIWLYKDIGFQGMVHVSPTTPYLARLQDFLARKHRLGIDAWGTSPTPEVAAAFDPIMNLIKTNVSNPEHLKLYPQIWRYDGRVTRVARTMLVAEFMVKEWADHFKGMSEEELDEMAKSFLFENCLLREGLNEKLRSHAPKVEN